MTSHDPIVTETRGWPGAMTYGVLALWFVVVLAAAFAGAFRVGPEDAPLPLLLGVAIPVAVFAAAYAASDRFRTYVLGLDLGLLTALQGWRVLGGGFLFLYAFDILPGLFAYPAGLGDVAIGAAAPFLAAALYTGGVSRRRLVLWNWLGLFDFVVAFTTGILTSGGAFGLLTGAVSNAPMQQLPLLLVPAFAVPVFILVHFAALLQLRQARAAAGQGAALPAT